MVKQVIAMQSSPAQSPRSSEVCFRELQLTITVQSGNQVLKALALLSQGRAGPSNELWRIRPWSWVLTGDSPSQMGGEVMVADRLTSGCEMDKDKIMILLVTHLCGQGSAFSQCP